MKSKINITLLAAFIGVAFTAELHADLLNPMDFASLGVFDVTNGAYVIDTDALTISETNASSTNVLFTGVMEDQDGQADSFGPGTNVTTVGSNGIPYIAVFTFDNLVMDGTATFTVTGHRALALLSQGDALVNVDLALDGVPQSQSAYSPLGGPAGSGGFDGGGAGGVNGLGPGGGTGIPNAGGTWFGAGGAGFGGLGAPGNYQPLYGPVYGNLRDDLQGGSGGGGMTGSNLQPAGGGGGGGALEIGAANTLTIGTAAVLHANGGNGLFSNPALSAGGSGSGGGIRLHAYQLVIDGTVAARGGTMDGFGGGGRVMRAGDASLPIYTVGSTPAASAFTSGVDVSTYLSPGYTQQGWITAVPSVTIVPLGTSVALGMVTVLQTNTASQPGVELAPGDLIVNGTVTVPAGGVTNHYSIELADAGATVTGSAPLAVGRHGDLSGKGLVEVPVAVLANGSASVGAGNKLGFTQPVTNSAGGFINNTAGTLTFPGGGNGLLNLGSLNLINAVINGDVHSPSNSIVNVAGTATFNGLFNGGASFSGTQNLVVFNGGYSPGASPAAVSFGGSVTLGSANTLTMELAGTNAGAQYDQVNVGATATLGGALKVVLTNGFVPAAGEVFHLINAAQQTNAFATVNLPALGAGLAWDNQIAANGSLAVVAAPVNRPEFGPLVLSGGNLIFSGTGGVTNGSYVLLSATNVATPVIDWVPVSTNPFDASGDFLLTNPINPSQPQEFYRLMQP